MPGTLKIVGGNSHDCFTLAEAATVLDPPVEAWQLELLVKALRIRPEGTRARYSPLGGRPPRTYRITTIMRLHSAVAPWLAGGFSG